MRESEAAPGLDVRIAMVRRRRMATARRLMLTVLGWSGAGLLMLALAVLNMTSR
jgi:hypothetical protein